MNNSLNADLQRVLESVQLNKIQFNAQKTQCCYLTHRNVELSSNLTLNNINVSETEKLDILGMSINNDMLWNSHIIKVAKDAAKCLEFLKICTKYFSPIDIRNISATYIRPKMEYISTFGRERLKHTWLC